ncbi:MAG: fibronectin, type domain protein [Candidatus Eremiobacteraeota bacterium]|nr:fibronectin, type domain protein [Candidatus Eremiobacteraeota bacterium]
MPRAARILYAPLFAAAVASMTACSGGSSGAVAPVSPAATASPQFPGAGPGQPTPGPGQSPAPPTPTPTASATARPGPTATPPSGPTPTPTPAPVVTVTPGAAVERLGSYRVTPQKIFVAGISAGGFFGVQMHVAHSGVFQGAAIYAGGVYHCAQDSVELALVECGGETVAGQALYQNTLAQSEAYLDQQSAAGTIDPSTRLQGQPVYLWSGTRDSVVNPKEMADLSAEYQHYGARVTFDSTFAAEHGWESPDGELPCGTVASPYMIACAQNGAVYDSQRTWLTLFLGNLAPRNNGALRGSLMRFDQTEFGASAGNSMDTNGTVFVPQPCAAGAACSFVVVFHGCHQGHSEIGDRFVTESGIDQWADTNNLIVLYPYAVPAPGPTPYNPNGCWDWWGYDDPSYSLKSGTQMSIVYRMVQRVTGAP